MSKQYYYAALRDGVVCYSEGQPVSTRRSPKQQRIPVRDFFAELGPGLITGAADDDPSGIATYSVTGAQFGYGPLWTALFSFPLMVSVQLMCSRLAMVTGRGLAAVVRRRYPRWVLWSACLLLVVANTINIGADLGGMADATPMITGVNSLVWFPLLCGPMIVLLFFSSYRAIARIFKWLTLVLFAYVITAFVAKPDWGAGAARHLHSRYSIVGRLPFGAGGNSGHDHFAVPVFLAGGGRSGRGAGQGRHRRAAAGRHRRGIATPRGTREPACSSPTW